MFGCWEYCRLKGRHKPGGLHYYPALLKPLDYDLPGCNHGDVNIYRLPQASVQLYFENLHHLIPCAMDAEFKLICKETGICKASLFVGLSQEWSSELPGCLAINHMHIIVICPIFLWVYGVEPWTAIRTISRSSGTGFYLLVLHSSGMFCLMWAGWLWLWHFAHCAWSLRFRYSVRADGSWVYGWYRVARAWEISQVYKVFRGNLYVLCFKTRLTWELRPKVKVRYWYSLSTATLRYEESVVLLTK